MDKTCSIVQDLLPLYEEDMLREETKEFVDGHLAQCAACRAPVSYTHLTLPTIYSV